MWVAGADGSDPEAGGSCSADFRYSPPQSGEQPDASPGVMSFVGSFVGSFLERPRPQWQSRRMNPSIEVPVD
jgi:hypothetical protein